MLNRLVYLSAQPSRHPLRRVTLFYLVLGAVAFGLATVAPSWFELATRPPAAIAAFSSDVFEPVSAGQVMHDQLEASARLFTSLLVALLLMLPVSWVYISVRARSGFDQGMAQSMLILPLAVAGIVTIVHDSIALAFSLAGIVAAVRFRSALRNSADGIYIFLSIGVGLAAGIGSLAVAAVVSMFFNYAILLLWRCDYGVCPQGGPMAEFSSGVMLERMGVVADDFPKLKKKKKKKKKSSSAREAPAIAASSAEVADASAPVEVEPAS